VSGKPNSFGTVKLMREGDERAWHDLSDRVRRGDLVTVSLQGEQGKPRPALVVQSDHFGELVSVTVLPITGTLIDAPLLRVPIDPPAIRAVAQHPRAARVW
jgi:hypothetical protein